MHCVAEILAARIPKQEEYVGVAPAVALVPWFFAGCFFPITAMPPGSPGFAKILPVTHALALSATDWSTIAAEACTTSGA